MQVERNVFINAFPKALSSDMNSLIDKLNLTTDHKSFEGSQINMKGEILSIPYRIYYNEPTQRNLTSKEIFLLDCIFTRHHNGCVREERLRKIIMSDDYLTTPFIVQLIGEYVVEILTVIKDNLSLLQVEKLKLFKRDNPDYWRIIEQRVYSYWDCYYKWTFEKTDYPGFHILNTINKIKIKN